MIRKIEWMKMKIKKNVEMINLILEMFIARKWTVATRALHGQLFCCSCLDCPCPWKTLVATISVNIFGHLDSKNSANSPFIRKIVAECSGNIFYRSSQLKITEFWEPKFHYFYNFHGCFAKIRDLKQLRYVNKKYFLKISHINGEYFQNDFLNFFPSKCPKLFGEYFQDKFYT